MFSSSLLKNKKIIEEARSLGEESEDYDQSQVHLSDCSQLVSKNWCIQKKQTFLDDINKNQAFTPSS